MKKYLTTKNIILALIAIGIVIFLLKLDSCRNNKFSRQQATIDSLTLANQQLVRDTNRLGQLLVKQPVIVVTDQKALKALALENLNLKDRDAKRIKQVNVLVTENTNLRIKDRLILFDTINSTTYIDTTKPCPANAILTPQNLTDTTDKDFKFYATLEKRGLKIDSLSFPDKQTIALVETKGGLFKRNIEGKIKFWTPKTMEVFVTHTNKYLEVEGMNSLVFKPKVKGRWLERALIVAGTVLITTQLLK